MLMSIVYFLLLQPDEPEPLQSCSSAVMPCPTHSRRIFSRLIIYVHHVIQTGAFIPAPRPTLCLSTAFPCPTTGFAFMCLLQHTTGRPGQLQMAQRGAFIQAIPTPTLTSAFPCLHLV